MSAPISLDLVSLRAAYSTGDATPESIVDLVYDRIAARGEDHVWIHLVPRADARAAAAALMKRRDAGESLPLFGVPFAVKDNIDVARLPTTAACPEFRYVAKNSAPVVQRLLDAGAILIGKTNLDQFATGLVGTRSPYGAPSSVFHRDYISGGSSSGSAVAVAAGLASFALGTDTAGSGRVPAAFNNIVGWKPTRGLLSTRGVVPACRSLDCGSVFALTCGDAREIQRVASAFDEADAFSRRAPLQTVKLPLTVRFGIPACEQLQFFGDSASAELFEKAIAMFEKIGGQRVEMDFAPFRETADLLYSGPWVAERLAAITPFIDEHPGALHPVTAKIINGGRNFSALETFRAFYELEALRRRAEAEWKKMDVLLLPTAGTIYTHTQVAADPVQLNTNLGCYTNFVNLLDLCGVAVPAGFRADGLPFGITLLAPAWCDDAVCALGEKYHTALGGEMGRTGIALTLSNTPAEPIKESDIQLAVVGAHLGGQPLNHQLTLRGAQFVRATRTAPHYRFYALPNTQPPKPGLRRVTETLPHGIAVEIWALDEAAFGSFVSEVPPPMVIGTIEVEDGKWVKGFLCEPFALEGAADITETGGWLAYLNDVKHEK